MTGMNMEARKRPRPLLMKKEFEARICASCGASLARAPPRAGTEADEEVSQAVWSVTRTYLGQRAHREVHYTNSMAAQSLTLLHAADGARGNGDALERGHLRR